MRGRFISLEGGEGAGKSTQLAALAGTLRDRGIDVVTTREPGGSDGAEAIRGLLLHGEGDRWNPRAEALLFAAARSDHVERTIRPALERGAWVLCDRFIDSSRAYQGQGSALGDDDIMTLHRIGSDGFLPDRTLLFVTERETALARLTARDGAAGDRFERRGDGFHADVAAAFLAFATSDPDRFRILDAGGSPEAVTEEAMAALADLLP